MGSIDNKVGRKNSQLAILFIIALLFSLFVQGAIPFLMAPTLGQAVWTTGFSQSFVNDSIFSVYARNFGAPEPAAIAFGLAGAWPTSIFMRLGMSAIDAYTLMAASWLSLAFFSAYKITRHFSVSPFLAILAATTWITMPVIWGHSGYSMLSLGISLLPFYFLAALKLFSGSKSLDWGRKNTIKIVLQHLFTCIVAVFMDGYSFMMFAVGSNILLMTSICGANKEKRIFLCKFAFPVHSLCLFFSYLLFAVFIGKFSFESSPIDFFRGWGVDVTFMILPSKGLHWIMDLLGISVNRTGKIFWGDASVWWTSFCAPIILAGIFSAWKLNRENKKIFGIVLVVIFGIYMALGPSLKFNSKKPDEYATRQMMPAEQAIIPTGSSILSSNLPGFKSMRASYRWLALGIFGSWVLSSMLLSSRQRKYKISGGILLSAVMLLNLPDIPRKVNGYINNRGSFFALERDLISEMDALTSPGDKLAFLPWRNDFLVNYASSKMKTIAYNIGGDKNLATARQYWPDTMRQFPWAVDARFSERVLHLLAKKEADVVILPYIDMLAAAHNWPSPLSLKEILTPAVQELSAIDVVNITKSKYFAAVKLAPEWREIATREILREICLSPVCLKQDGFVPSSFHTKVGVLNGRRLESTGNKGMLHLGPYLPMERGVYRLIIHGNAKTAGAAWVDVASDKGNIIHGRFNLTEKDKDSDQALIVESIALDHDVSDLEIRVYVDSGDEVSLSGYSFRQE